MVAAEAEAKQLESVTDRVVEAELDASKAQQAMTALSTANKDDDVKKAAALAAVAISKDDVSVIVHELEVSEEVAESVLREVSLECNKDATTKVNVLETALRRLLSS
mmetsp:Transcript_10306/g.18812  ORF Transcript_10306/g.18812 Transcript_10306/m.18812 type:complete len:107 (-) Transcript_10306:2184-2504(-)